MTDTRSDAEPWCIHAFNLSPDGGEVRWQSPQAWPLICKDRGINPRIRLPPGGALAGSTRIIGRGRRVKLSGHVVTTADIRDAKLHAGRWWWQRSADEPTELADDPYALHAERALERAALARIALTERGLVWQLDVPGQAGIRAGDPVRGSLLTGRARTFVTLGGTGVMTHDLIGFLQTGRWPWPTERDPDFWG